MLIKEIPEEDRPREKFASRGAHSLSDAEILALLFGTGRAGLSAIDLAREVLGRYQTLRNLSRATVAELTAIKGIGPAKATQVVAALEFARRLSQESFREQPIQSPEDVYDLIGATMQALDQESVRIILLNHRKKLIQVAEIFRGTGSECFAHPAEILRRALSHSAHSLILVHNHPSGDPSPSRADHDATKRLHQACQAVGIDLTDHIIIGAPSASNREPYFSFREAGCL
jgi:DNA repair protein RadC